MTLPTFKCLGPLYTSGTVKATNLKFGVQIDYNECYSKNTKLEDKLGGAYTITKSQLLLNSVSMLNFEFLFVASVVRQNGRLHQ